MSNIQSRELFYCNSSIRPLLCLPQNQTREECSSMSSQTLSSSTTHNLIPSPIQPFSSFMLPYQQTADHLGVLSLWSCLQAWFTGHCQEESLCCDVLPRRRINVRSSSRSQKDPFGCRLMWSVGMQTPPLNYAELVLWGDRLIVFLHSFNEDRDLEVGIKSGMKIASVNSFRDFFFIEDHLSVNIGGEQFEFRRRINYHFIGAYVIKLIG